MHDAVAAWVRAHYYLARPWMHPRATRDPALRHVPVTESLIAAEAGLYRAFIGDESVPEQSLDIRAAVAAGASVWQDDLVEIGAAKGKKQGIGAVATLGQAPVSTRRRRVIEAPEEAPPRRRRRLFD